MQVAVQNLHHKVFVDRGEALDVSLQDLIATCLQVLFVHHLV
jgi:hypothetical protein|eukprot:COSAG02_NODE_557_length_20379_cov_6.688215_17_plen_42_part_00